MRNDCSQALDAKTIETLGLQLTGSLSAAETNLSVRVFKYPLLKDVYIMESDLYGNIMQRIPASLLLKDIMD